MNDTLSAALGWVIPAAIVFGVTALAIVALIWSLRRSRRSPRARAAAAAQKAEAGAALVRLDDAIAELDLEVAMSGALYEGTAPPVLRRARISAQQVRDASFQEFGDLPADALPDPVRNASRRISARANEAAEGIARARAEHASWMQTHVTAAQQVTAARRRQHELQAERGDPTALVRELTARFDRSEWDAAATAATAATASLAEADRLLAEAEARAGDPTRSALAALAQAERSLRDARDSTRALDETYRLVIDAALAVPAELEAAHAALRQAAAVREGLDPAASARLAAEMRAYLDGLTAVETDAARRPTATVHAIARLRERLDLALGDARSAQQRLRGARTALPGTLAAARNAVARAEASVSSVGVTPAPGTPAGNAATVGAGAGRSIAAGVDARVRLDSAQRELAAARASTDPVDALDAGRRALRLAEDAIALVDHARLGAPSAGSAAT